MSSVCRESGFSLVEMMLACFIGILLIQSVAEIYSSNKRTYSFNETLARLQEDARFAGYLLSQDMRMAGDYSCEQVPPYHSSLGALRGYRSDPPLPIKSKIKKNTDSIVMERCRFREGVQHFDRYAFFVGETSRKNKVGQVIYALYESPMLGDKVELIPNVTDMHVLYGVAGEDGGSVQAYLSADEVLDWGSVKALEIRLLLSSEDPVLSDPVDYLFNGVSYEKTRYLKREWSVYVLLRERY